MTTRRWVALGSVCLLLLVMLVPTAKSYYDQRSRLQELEQQVATQESNVKALEREKELWATDDYVEAQARKRLKFVKVGDKAYTVIDPKDAPAVDAETGAVQAAPDQAWYEQLGSSLRAADAPAESGAR